MEISVLDPRYLSIHICSLHRGHTIKLRIWVQWVNWMCYDRDHRTKFNQQEKEIKRIWAPVFFVGVISSLEFIANFNHKLKFL